jgi:hypothetical protein
MSPPLAVLVGAIVSPLPARLQRIFAIKEGNNSIALIIAGNDRRPFIFHPE